MLGPKRAVAWRVLDAQYLGVAQRRRRVFVVASARDDFDPRAVLFESEGVRRDTAPSREQGEGTAETASEGTRDWCSSGKDLANTTTREGINLDTETTTIICHDVAATLDARNSAGGFPGTDGALGGHVIAFDTTQITSKLNRSNPKPGDPCHPISATAHPPTICFDSKQYARDAVVE